MVTLKINNGNCLLLAWNNGKEVLRLVLTSLTTPGLQIHYGWPHPDSKYTDQSAAAVLCLMSPPANGRHAFTDMCTNCLSDAIIIYLNNSFSLTQQRPICESPSHSSMSIGHETNDMSQRVSKWKPHCDDGVWLCWH